MSQNVQNYEGQARVHPRLVYYTGSDRLRKGMGLCYKLNYGTATDAEQRRGKWVEKPTTGNSLAFAGVVDNDYPARSGGQWVTIFEPGSICEIALGANTLVNSTHLSCSVCSADAGRWAFSGFEGRGSAIALQTCTGSNGVLSARSDGTATLDATGLILTDASATFQTSGVAAGDTVVIFAGEADGTNVATPGVYTVATVTGETTLTLTTAASDGGTMLVDYYIHRGNPTCLALLQDGDESGLYEVISPVGGAARTPMPHGMTYLAGGTAWALGTGDCTGTLINNTKNGTRKGFFSLGTYSANDYLLTVSSGIRADGSTALQTAEFDAVNDLLILEWHIDTWYALIHRGPTLT